MPKCNDQKLNIKITSAEVGYGCTKDAAMNDFFKKVLEKINKERHCSEADCDAGNNCVPELIPGLLETKLQYHPVGLARCEGSGWKCFLFDEPHQSAEYEARCTCAP
jgi:hypothetical protein